jgi:hypothetical protein
MRRWNSVLALRTMFKIEAAPKFLTGRSDPSPAVLLSLQVGYTERPQPSRHAFHSCFPKVTLGGVQLDATVVGNARPEIDGDEHFALDLLVPVPFNTLEQIERARQQVTNGSVGIGVELHLSVCKVVESGPSETLAPPKRLLPGRHINAFRHNVARDEWLHVILGIGFADVLVFEFPRRPPGGTTPSGAALVTLRSARDALFAGDYDSVAARCYFGLEALAPGPGQIVDRIRDQHFSQLNPVVSARVHSALVAAMPLFHIGRHATLDAQGVVVGVSRAHATFLIGVTELVFGLCAGVP